MDQKGGRFRLHSLHQIPNVEFPSVLAGPWNNRLLYSEYLSPFTAAFLSNIQAVAKPIHKACLMGMSRAMFWKPYFGPSGKTGKDPPYSGILGIPVGYGQRRQPAYFTSNFINMTDSLLLTWINHIKSSFAVYDKLVFEGFSHPTPCLDVLP